MYLQHFGLRELPFSLTPNTQFFLNMASYHKAYNMLIVSLANAEGFIKIVGEVGTGKTMLCRKVLNTLEEDKERVDLSDYYRQQQILDYKLALLDEEDVSVCFHLKKKLENYGRKYLVR